jgi:hypothetical protein
VKNLRNAGFEVVDVESEEDAGFEMFEEKIKMNNITLDRNTEYDEETQRKMRTY